MIRILLILGAIILLLPACSHIPKNYYLANTHLAKSYNERIQYLIFHFTAENNIDSLRILTTEKVSAHYLVSAKENYVANMPKVYILVAEEKRAWHAGSSFWSEKSNLNDTSLGIEIVNPGYRHDSSGNFIWYKYEEAQIKAIIELSQNIIKRYQIKPQHILAHSDIAPLRKLDPGPLFPWQRLAENGIGAWPDAQLVQYYLANHSPFDVVPVLELQRALKQYGYTEMPLTGVLDDDTQKIIAAFQMHFRSENFAGDPDAETLAIAKALLHQYSENNNLVKQK